MGNAFVQRLRELGWIEGRTLAIEYRWAEGRPEKFAEIAAEFVRLKVDVIVTHSTGPAIAAKEATSVIPIVFANAGDPVAAGLVASLARPGGNITGLSIQATDTVGKRLNLLREVASDIQPTGDHGQCWQSRFCAGNGGGSSDGPHAWPRRHPNGVQSIRGHRSGLRSTQRTPGCSLYVAPDPLMYSRIEFASTR